MTAFPVGHYLGELHPAGDHVVRIGRDLLHLSEDEFDAWLSVHEAAELAVLAGVGSGVGRPVAPAGLAARGLVAEVADPVTFAQSYRVIPLLTGFGNTSDAPFDFAIGIPGLPPSVVVDIETFQLWQWGHAAPSLWAACVVLAEVSGTTSEALLDALLGGLRTLIAGCAAYLDVP